jgi:hypothetical protein
MYRLQTLLLAASLLAASVHAQLPCWNQGSDLLPAAWEAGPVLGCAASPAWPYWHLYTPEHRAVVSRPGYRQGEARELPRLLVHYRCTGFWLVPVVIDRVRVMGQVLDVAQEACVPVRPISP